MSAISSVKKFKPEFDGKKITLILDALFVIGGDEGWGPHLRDAQGQVVWIFEDEDELRDWTLVVHDPEDGAS